jgi:hypothetical protein
MGRSLPICGRPANASRTEVTLHGRQGCLVCLRDPRNLDEWPHCPNCGEGALLVDEGAQSATCLRCGWPFGGDVA